jgi:hypothetical protein
LLDFKGAKNLKVSLMRQAAIPISGLLMLCFIPIELYGQRQTDTGFTVEKRFIDSLALSIDTSKSLSQKRIAGILTLGEYYATCYYSKEFRKIAKLECYFSADSIGQKTFYYYKNNLIKVKYNETSYYNFRNLVDTNGAIIDQLKSKELLEFSNESISITERLLE